MLEVNVEGGQYERGNEEEKQQKIEGIKYRQVKEELEKERVIYIDIYRIRSNVPPGQISNRITAD